MDLLLKKNAEFHWSCEQEEAFKRAKEVIASPLLFTHYDPKLEIVVAAGASNYSNGVGAVIAHRLENGTEKTI
ncbi:unnamed protein product [Nippostrongylus brasiliensis]|uniref:RT_RNaseH_2 domain-containing protein n=1 Tax=Nippostrongylus brasiliensis TaxID=27835 RepID=A0A0N4YRY9_NIPBR|nr:unnamed protein product [Nippostrongylus brasiliensis]